MDEVESYPASPSRAVARVEPQLSDEPKLLIADDAERPVIVKALEENVEAEDKEHDSTAGMNLSAMEEVAIQLEDEEEVLMSENDEIVAELAEYNKTLASKRQEVHDRQSRVDSLVAKREQNRKLLEDAKAEMRKLADIARKRKRDLQKSPNEKSGSKNSPSAKQSRDGRDPHLRVTRSPSAMDSTEPIHGSNDSAIQRSSEQRTGSSHGSSERTGRHRSRSERERYSEKRGRSPPRDSSRSSYRRKSPSQPSAATGRRRNSSSRQESSSLRDSHQEDGEVQPILSSLALPTPGSRRQHPPRVEWVPLKTSELKAVQAMNKFVLGAGRNELVRHPVTGATVHPVTGTERKSFSDATSIIRYGVRRILETTGMEVNFVTIDNYGRVRKVPEEESVPAPADVDLDLETQLGEASVASSMPPPSTLVVKMSTMSKAALKAATTGGSSTSSLLPPEDVLPPKKSKSNPKPGTGRRGAKKPDPTKKPEPEKGEPTGPEPEKPKPKKRLLLSPTEIPQEVIDGAKAEVTTRCS